MTVQRTCYRCAAVTRPWHGSAPPATDHTPRGPAAALAAARSGGTGRAAAAGEIRSVTSDVERAPATLDERTRPANTERVPPPCPTPPRRREPSPTAPPTAARHTSAFYRPLLTLVTVARVRRAGPSVPPSSVAAACGGHGVRPMRLAVASTSVGGKYRIV